MLLREMFLCLQCRFNGNGDPSYLTNGVAPYAPGTKGRQEYGDWTYTGVFPICLERVVGEVCKPFVDQEESRQ